MDGKSLGVDLLCYFASVYMGIASALYGTLQALRKLLPSLMGVAS